MTGANRGLGLETSRQLLAKGLTVVMAGRDEAALGRARAALSNDEQSRAAIIRMDVTDARSIANAHHVVRERVGPVDVLVNNAAVLVAENDDVLSIPADAYRRTFDTNVFGVIEVSRALYPTWCSDDMGASSTCRQAPASWRGCRRTPRVFDVQDSLERVHSDLWRHLQGHGRAGECCRSGLGPH